MARGHGRHVAEHERFGTLANHTLYRSLLRAGSLVFIPQKTPIVELTPTMIVGIVMHGYKQFSIVATLKKEFDSFYSNSAAIKQDSHLEPKKQWFLQLTEEVDNALEAFKELQRTYPLCVIVYRLVDSFDKTLSIFDAE